LKAVKTFLLFALALVTLAGCSSAKPDSTVEQLFKAIQNFDFEAISLTIAPSARVAAGVSIADFQDQSNELPAEFFDYIKKNASKVTFKITDSQTTDDKAIVTVSTKYVDAGPIVKASLGEFIAQAMGFAFSSTDMTEDQSKQLFMSIMNEQIETLDEQFAEKTTQIELELVDKNWYISALSDDMLDVITSGFLSAVADISNLSDLGEEEAADPNATPVATPTPDPKRVLSEINNYVISDIWNDGFIVVDSFLKTGTGPTGASVDLEFTKSQLTLAMTKKAEYDAYIAGLDSSYNNIKDVWGKLSPEIDSLYQQIQSGALTLDTGIFVQYRDAFSKLIYDL
jgi:hypothetical protein